MYFSIHYWNTLLQCCQKQISQLGKIAILNRKKRIQFINETFAAIKEIKIFAIEKYFFKRFRIQNTSLSKIFFKHAFISIYQDTALEYILFLTIISLIFFFIQTIFHSHQ